MVPARYKRFLLRKIAADAVSQSITLEAALLAAGTARITDTEAGRTLIGTAGNGHQVTFTIPNVSAAGFVITPVDIAEAISELLDLYYASETNLGGTPSDDQIKTEMLDRIHPIRSMQTCWTSIRYQGTG